MTSVTERNLDRIVRAEQNIYDHLLECVRSESPERVVERYRCLLIQGTGYRDRSLLQDLYRLAEADRSEQDFRAFINRCWYIAINYWQMQPPLRRYIPELIELFEHVPGPPGGYFVGGVSKVRKLLKSFTNSEQYIKLRHLCRLIEGKAEQKTLGTLIVRYPYLYEYCLVSEDSDEAYKKSISTIRRQTQQRFELDLSKYVTHQVRLAQLRQRYDAKLPQQKLLPVKNPTLLSDRDLNRALKHFIGNIYGEQNYRDLAHSFITHSYQTPSFRAFKDKLYEYLISTIDSKYGNRQFNRRLYQAIQETLPQCDYQKPEEFLVLRTAVRLMQFLVVESQYNPNHYVFLDLVSNLGPTRAIGILLQLVLLSHKAKPYLDKRFSILFNHYESTSLEGASWLVASLENLHLASTVHFGKVDLSYWKQLR